MKGSTLELTLYCDILVGEIVEYICKHESSIPFHLKNSEILLNMM